MTEDELKEIEARVNSATRGPWTTEAGKYSGDNWLIGSIFVGNSLEDGEDYCVHITTDSIHASELGISDAKSDADFIAHAREDIPALLAEVRRLRGD